jgi:putative endonuclease
MYFVYILECMDGSFYTGSTNDIEKRFKAHITGKGGKYTRSHKPQKIIYQEALASKSLALKRELEIKSWSKTKKEAIIAEVGC